MFNRNIPSLRNFAVLEIEHRSLKGKVYRVQDRRTAKHAQLLFVPNRSVSWPRYLSSFEKLGGAPVRLRNSRVAFLLDEGLALKQIMASLSAVRRMRWRFNALAGFSSSALIGSKRALILVFSACLITLGFNLFFARSPVISEAKDMQQTELLPKGKMTCNEDIHVGGKFRLNRKASEIFLSGVRHEVKNVQRFGGFLRATVQSKCIGKRFVIEAWLHGKTYEVSYVA